MKKMEIAEIVEWRLEYCIAKKFSCTKWDLINYLYGYIDYQDPTDFHVVMDVIDTVCEKVWNKTPNMAVLHPLGKVYKTLDQIREV